MMVLKVPRLVGVLALLAGFMAVSASVAQAEGTWLDNGVAITGNTPVDVKAETETIFLTKVGLSKVEILCPKVKLVSANLTITGGLRGHIHWEECITKLNSTLSVKCTPHSSGTTTAGLIETLPLDGSLRLSGGVQYLELLPEVAGGAFIDLVLGPECPIGNNINITGKVWLKDCEGRFLTDLVEHLLQEEPVLSSLLFGGNAVTIDGSIWMFLPSGHTFAGHV
jgi:hypothetical protein